MSRERESRPGGGTRTAAISSGDKASLPASADYYTDAAAHVIGAFVAVVETSHGTPRRRVFLTLKAAEATVLRARMAGHRASVVLCTLLPVTGGESL